MCGKPCGKLGVKVWKNKTRAVDVEKIPQNKPSILTFFTRKSYEIGWKTTFQRLLITLINC